MTYTSENIRVLRGLDGVRMRPAMYIGSTDERGLHHLVYELVDNAIDEAMAGYCSSISVTIHENGSVTVTDNGRGIPVDTHAEEGRPAAEVVLTTLHSGGKFDNQTYKVSGGLHGVGVSVVNALSSSLFLEIKRDGKVWSQEYAKGVPLSPLTGQSLTKERGTSITFTPDATIFETVEFSFETLAARMRELAFLNPGVTITVTDERCDDKSAVFRYEGGVVSFVAFLNASHSCIHPRPIAIKGEKNGIIVDAAFQYTDTCDEKVFTFANNIHTSEGGAHLAGFRAALTRTLNAHPATADLIRREKLTITGEDLREGMTAVVSVKTPNPQFEGQTKTKLGGSEIKSVVDTLVSEALSAFFDNNPKVARDILTKAMESVRAREAARKARELSRKRGSCDSLVVSGKLADCQERDPSVRELFIVEGDSAGGSAKQGRDRRFQAVLPLKGKIINVEKTRLDKVLASQEIASLVSALGTGIGKRDFDISRLRYHRVIIMTDADVDGAHIQTLLLTFFFRQMPSLIHGGHLYVAQPPLYRMRSECGDAYLASDADLQDALIALGARNARLLSGGRSIDLTAVALLAARFDRLRRHVLKACHAQRLEDVFAMAEPPLSARDDIDTIQDILARLPALSSLGRLLVGGKTVHIEDWGDIVTALGSAGLNGVSIQRFKGLGEMNPDQLWETTMKPETRRLLKVSIRDAIEADRLFGVLMGDAVEPRRQFITEHAHRATIFEGARYVR